MLETLGSTDSYGSGDASIGSSDYRSSPSINHYLDIFKRRFFYFLFPFGLISILGLLFAATLKPDYLSEGKILVEAQSFAPDLVRPITTASANERIQVLQQRIITRDTLISIANKFGLFPNRSDIAGLMRQSLKIRPAEVGGQPPQSTSTTTAFMVSFEYGDPEVAMRVANEFVTLFVGEDTRSRTNRATETVKILTSEARDIEDKLESTQLQIFDVERRPRETVADIPEQQKSQVAALAALKAELIQKSSVYSDAHPVVTALKKRIAAMEKTLTQPAASATQSQPTSLDDIDALKRQREALEKRLAEANAKLATARLTEKMDRDQQFERLQVVEAPTLPQRPVKSGRLKIVGIAMAAAMMLGVGCVIAAEFLDGSIRGRHQLLGVVASPLIISIPYISTNSDVVRARIRIAFGLLSLVVLMAILGGLAAAIVLGVSIDLTSLDKAGFGLRIAGQ